jgi:hypothetical protein
MCDIFICIYTHTMCTCIILAFILYQNNYDKIKHLYNSQSHVSVISLILGKCVNAENLSLILKN